MGIDLTGGTQTEYQYVSPTGSVDTVISAARTYATDLKKTFVHATQPTVNDVNIYRITGTENFIVEAGFSLRSGMTDIDLEKVKQDFHDQLSAKLISVYPTGITQVRYQNVGEAFGSYIRSSAVRTLALAIVMISLYIMYAFWGSIRGMSSWPFAVVTGVSLVHDVVVAAGLYVIVSYFFPEFKIDIFFITAMLTVL
jgi:preprotein translocase subunit SecF